LPLLEALPLSAKVIDFGVHPSKEEFSRSGGDPCPLELEDFPALPSDLNAHVLDFGPDVIYPHSAPSMMVRIGVMKALNRHVEREFNPDATEHHWGKRKPKRDL